MTLAELINGLPILETGGDLSQEISAVAYDSRKVTAGTVFVCIEGYITDGHAYITQAVERSAAAVIIQKKTVSHQIPWVLVPNTRRALAHISDRFFAHPSGKLDMIGLTGTKGKTTATYMTRAILSAQGRRAGLIGTIATIIGDQVIQASRTTPESYDLQAILNQMVQSRMDTCVMEVSSQGLML
ncbi:MAG: UDP-N-acetylmuramoyl-L-alanyl-D-glutamate--2,6-diaminopimelate ligase, partial [Clostridiaceae bacterium]|nr:UDP-N-acetylmuramoyl-L-alanyl-D-glutamate--2,6-diaminopimelate ligase [Clostridiaceae bacterium]